jgi:hypothetical protein
MTEITFQFDKRATESINDLMKHYKIHNKAALISKAIAVLQIAAHVDKTKGQLFARKGEHETKIVIR